MNPFVAAVAALVLLTAGCQVVPSAACVEVFGAPSCQINAEWRNRAW